MSACRECGGVFEHAPDCSNSEPIKQTLKGAAIWALKEGIEILREIRNSTRSIDDTMHKFLEELVQYQEMEVKKLNPVAREKGEIARILNEADAEEKAKIEESKNAT